MSARKPRTELAQHLAWADTLRAACRAVQTLSVQIGNAYPATGVEARDADRAAKALGKLRSTLENAAARDLGAVFNDYNLFYYAEPRKLEAPRAAITKQALAAERAKFAAFPVSIALAGDGTGGAEEVFRLFHPQCVTPCTGGFAYYPGETAEAMAWLQARLAAPVQVYEGTPGATRSFDGWR